jgi:hypothetical protein
MKNGKKKSDSFVEQQILFILPLLFRPHHKPQFSSFYIRLDCPAVSV